MKKFFLIFTLIFCSSGAFSQYGINFYNFRPTGDLGFVMKPTVSLELSYGQNFEDEEDRFRLGISITYLHLTPRMDVFPVYAYLSDGTGVHIVPGTESYQKFNMAFFAFGPEFALLYKEKYDVFLGIDAIGGATSEKYESDYTGVKSSSYDGGSAFVGLRFKVGAEYFISDKLHPFIKAQRSFVIAIDPNAAYSFNTYNIGVKIYLND